MSAVMPYFPYSRQSKKKSHRGAITARMIANLLNVAGVNHVITIDLHASQMQGFFKCPVDNLVAEPLIARWLKHNVPNWQDAVVVSKNPGGTKRVTSLADAMKLSFGIVTTERRRPHTYSAEYSVTGSVLYETLAANGGRRTSEEDREEMMARRESQTTPTETREEKVESSAASSNGDRQYRRPHAISNPLRRSYTSAEYPSSPLARSALPGNSPREPSPNSLARTSTTPEAPLSHADEIADEFTDEVPQSDSYLLKFY
jgi:ribose-phosphate pyrophosphokinase